MKSCQLRLIHLLWWGVAAKCLDYLVAAPVTFTQNLLIWTCYLMWALAVVLMTIACVHEWQTVDCNPSKKGGTA